jgi:MscS family membrane protein
VITKTIAVAASKTTTDVDDAIVEIIRRPIFLSVLLYGLSWTADVLELPEGFDHPIDALLETLAILIWTAAVIRVGTVLLQSGSAKARERSMLQPRTLPVFDIALKTLAIGTSIYFMFLAWDIDVTAWLASAGILGIAVGFAAKDTLANLFSGIFILADGPYKVKDWIVLDNQLRGEVTHIGIRSTRVLTNDDVEITVPNAVIGNAQVLNECGGPHVRQRVKVNFSVAYGSDVAQVREVVLAGLAETPHIMAAPAPMVRFRELGESGLAFDVCVWIEIPRIRDMVIDQVTTRIYNSLNAANIEIPYAKTDVYIKQMP